MIPKKIKKLFRYHKAIILYSVAILVGIGLFIGVTIPMFQRILTSREQLIAIRSDIKILQEKVSLLSAYDSEVLNSHLTSLNKALPASKNPALLLDTIEQTGAQADVGFVNMSIAAPGPLASESATVSTSNEKLIRMLSGTTRVVGTSEQITAFIRNIQNIKPLIRITGVTISYLSATGENSTVGNATIQFDGLYAQMPERNSGPLVPLSPFEKKDVLLLSSIADIPVFEDSQTYSLKTYEVDGRNPFGL